MTAPTPKEILLRLRTAVDAWNQQWRENFPKTEQADQLLLSALKLSLGYLCELEDRVKALEAKIAPTPPKEL